MGRPTSRRFCEKWEALVSLLARFRALMADCVFTRHGLVFTTNCDYDAARHMKSSPSVPPNAMTKQLRVCCSSPAAICYWLTVSLVAWGLLSLIAIYWRPLRASSEATCLFALTIGCLANWLKNRTFHCAITGPLFLIGGFLLLLSSVRVIHVNPRWVWPFVLVGVGIAFVLEWLYARRPAS